MIAYAFPRIFAGLSVCGARKNCFTSSAYVRGGETPSETISARAPVLARECAVNPVAKDQNLLSSSSASSLSFMTIFSNVKIVRHSFAHTGSGSHKRARNRLCRVVDCIHLRQFVCFLCRPGQPISLASSAGPLCIRIRRKQKPEERKLVHDLWLHNHRHRLMYSHLH